MHADTMTDALPMSAEKLHEILTKSYVLGNRARRRFIGALLAMDESRLYLHLGFSSITQYAERSFGCQRSATYDFLMVAKALRHLPECESAFALGRLSWSALREIVKVARGDTENEWIEFAHEHTLGQLLAEVRDAEKKGRAAPRKGSYGLPRLTARVVFELEPEESDIFWKALRKAGRELAVGLGEDRVSSKDALLYLARRMLETDPATGEIAGRVERDGSSYTIVYHRCRECRTAHVPTPDGPVEIPGEVVDRVENEARKVELDDNEAAVQVPASEGERDRPNTYTIVKKVALRDGQVCTNPACRRRIGLHAHHIRFRMNGGRTRPENEVLVCSWCHAAIHMGLLKLEGDPLTGFKWTPRSAELQPAIDDELREMASVPEVRVAGESTAVDKSTAMDVPVPDERPDERLVTALVNVGYPQREARERIAKGLKAASSGGRQPTEEAIVLAAMRA